MYNTDNKIKNFFDLNAWKEAHKLVLMIYQLIRRFPNDERYGLSDQMRRAVVSITSNIAEGFSRRSSKEKIQFYSMSLGSLTEIQNQLFVAKDVNYLIEKDFPIYFEQTIVVQRLINGLTRSLNLHAT